MKTLSLVGIFPSITGTLATVLILVIGQKYLFPVLEFSVENEIRLYTRIAVLYYFLVPGFGVIFLFFLFLSLKHIKVQHRFIRP